MDADEKQEKKMENEPIESEESKESNPSEGTEDPKEAQPSEATDEKKRTRRPSKKRRAAEESEEPEPPKTESLKQRLSKKWKKIQLIKWIRDLRENLHSSDAATRWVSVVCLSSGFALILIVLAVGIHVWHKHRVSALIQQQKLAQLKEEQNERELEAERNRANVITLGTFLLELKPLSPEERKVSRPQTANMAEVDIVIVCADNETRNYINEHMIQVKDHLTQLFSPVSRSDILSPEGKRQLRDYLRIRMNEWLPRGSIKELFFPRLAVS